MKDRYSEIDRIKEEVETLIQDCLNLPKGRTSIVASHKVGGNMSIHIRLSEYYSSYQNTDYFSNSKSFIHFTNFKSAISIIKSRRIRLYNLYYKNDKSEFSYASKILKGFNKPTEYSFSNIEYETNQIKFNTFILSSTVNDSLNDFWNKKYSSKGHGIGIEFSFYNNPLKWDDFYYSSVKYGELKKLIEFRKGLTRLKRKNPNVEYKVNLNQALAFHKKKLYKNENETRLLALNPQEKKIIVYKDTGNENIKFINIPILSNNERDSEILKLSKIPVLKIECIHFGPKLTAKNNEMINSILTELYSYKIKREITLPNKGCNQFGLNELRSRVGTQECS